MRKYDIYLLEEEVAYHYFGREQVLYHFFVEAANPVPYLEKIIEKQLHYITRSIPFFIFDYHLKRNDLDSKKINMKRDPEKLTIYSDRSKAVLIKEDRYLTLISSGNIEAETLVFEHLRKLEHTFLAIDIEGNSIGWLSPIKQAHYV